jgi:EAL domain-containing protein (putative c-di-GMP-specific phosphodiesterase class I)
MGLLHALQEMGVRLSIDDFGTGYSSLSYLKRLPVHEIKIDRSFITAMVGDADDETIVRSIINLAGSLSLDVVAEGVEDAVTWKRLDQMGCAFVQGYYLSRPIPVDDLLPWLRDRPALAPPLQDGVVAGLPAGSSGEAQLPTA